MAGFKNAPCVTAFAVGMRIHWEEPGEVGWKTVRWIEGDVVHCRVDDDGAYEPVRSAQTQWYFLDLDSIWVGRRYVSRSNDDVIVTILAVDDCYVVWGNGRGNPHDVAWRSEFLLGYRPVPLGAVAGPVALGSGALLGCAEGSLVRGDDAHGLRELAACVRKLLEELQTR